MTEKSAQRTSSCRSTIRVDCAPCDARRRHPITNAQAIPGLPWLFGRTTVSARAMIRTVSTPSNVYLVGRHIGDDRTVEKPDWRDALQVNTVDTGRSIEFPGERLSADGELDAFAAGDVDALGIGCRQVGAQRIATRAAPLCWIRHSIA